MEEASNGSANGGEGEAMVDHWTCCYQAAAQVAMGEVAALRAQQQRPGGEEVGEGLEEQLQQMRLSAKRYKAQAKAADKELGEVRQKRLIKVLWAVCHSWDFALCSWRCY